MLKNLTRIRYINKQVYNKLNPIKLICEMTHLYIIL